MQTGPVYSGIEVLARSLAPSLPLSEHRMAVYAAYYDASGSEGAPTEPLVVGCLVSTVDRWVAFEQEWRQALIDAVGRHVDHRPFGLNAWLGGTGLFEGMGEESGGTDFLSSLLGIIERHTELRLTVHLTPEVFTTVNRDWDLTLLGGAYALTTMGTISRVFNWEQHNCPDGRTCVHEHLVESGDTGQEHLSRALASLDVDGFMPIPRPKFNRRTRQMLWPFQACDLLAGLTQRQLVGRPHAAGETVATLLKPHIFLYDEVELRMNCRHSSLFPARHDDAW